MFANAGLHLEVFALDMPAAMCRKKGSRSNWRYLSFERIAQLWHLVGDQLISMLDSSIMLDREDR